MGVLADLIALVNGNTEKTLDVLIQERATETNSNIANVDAKVQAGNNLVGANNNTGGSVGVGSLSARINKLLTDWTTTRAGYLDTINANIQTLLNGRVVKSVQSGVVLPSAFAYETQLTINHNQVELDKSLVLLSGPLGRSGDLNPTWIVSRNPILSTSYSFTIGLGFTPNQTGAISWQVIEFY